jgi:asparagine synthase (glutamine-hydrolysing)
MTRIAGWVGHPENDELVEKLKRTLLASYSQISITPSSSAFATCLADKEAMLSESGYTLALSGFPHLEGNPCRDNSYQKIIKNYVDNEDKFLSSLSGAFSLVLLDEKKKQVILAIDRLGQQSLYYAQVPNGLVFGSTAESVICHPEVEAKIQLQSVYDYVYFHHCPSPGTIYQNVHKLEGGQRLRYCDGKVALDYYWQPDFRESMAQSVEEAGQELQETLIHAVEQLTGNVDETGAFLSGGLDSSSVAGALSKVYPEQAKTFSIGFPVEEYNEISYARMASDHFKTKQYEYYLTPEDTVDAIPKIAAFYDEPFGNSSALPAYYCAKFAKEHGINVLLGGDGGDELFAGNERYTLQLLFQHYQKAPSFARSGLEGLLSIMPDSLTKSGLLFKANRYIEQANTPLPDRLQDYNFLHRHPSTEIFQADFLEQVNIASPLQYLRDSYNRPEGATALNKMLHMDWKSTLHDNDLVKVNRMCEMAGVEVRYPMLADELVALSCRIPSNIKLKNRKLRWFYKDAMKDFLPEKIINKPKHGFGLPFGIWMKEHSPLKELAYDSIHDLKKRGYFKAEFLDHAIEMHQSIHAAYYGELIWVLMMLEQWFATRKR